MLLKENGPWLACRSANEDVGMIHALFVASAERVILSREPAVSEDFVGLCFCDSEGDDGGRLRSRISAIPLRVGCADGRWQAVCRPIQFNRTILAVVARRNAKMSLLFRRQGVANGCDGANKLSPAELLAQVAISFECEIL